LLQIKVMNKKTAFTVIVKLPKRMVLKKENNSSSVMLAANNLLVENA